MLLQPLPPQRQHLHDLAPQISAHVPRCSIAIHSHSKPPPLAAVLQQTRRQDNSDSKAQLFNISSRLPSCSIVALRCKSFVHALLLVFSSPDALCRYAKCVLASFSAAKSSRGWLLILSTTLLFSLSWMQWKLIATYAGGRTRN